MSGKVDTQVYTVITRHLHTTDTCVNLRNTLTKATRSINKFNSVSDGTLTTGKSNPESVI